jgi:ribosome-associated translation inhibitor RaiA
LTVHFQVRTDNHIENSEELTSSIRAEVEGALSDRFLDRIRRIEVYLQDMNAHKGGVDTRCSIEVSLAGHQPVAVDDRATGVDEAVSGAIDKMMHVLDRTLGRIEDRNGRVSMSGEET